MRMSITVEDGMVTSPNVNLLMIDDGFEDLFSGKLQVWDLLIIEIFATFMFVILCLGIGDL